MLHVFSVIKLSKALKMKCPLARAKPEDKLVLFPFIEVKLY